MYVLKHTYLLCFENVEYLEIRLKETYTNCMACMNPFLCLFNLNNPFWLCFLNILACTHFLVDICACAHYKLVYACEGEHDVLLFSEIA